MKIQGPLFATEDEENLKDMTPPFSWPSKLYLALTSTHKSSHPFRKTLATPSNHVTFGKTDSLLGFPNMLTRQNPEIAPMSPDTPPILVGVASGNETTVL